MINRGKKELPYIYIVTKLITNFYIKIKISIKTKKNITNFTQ